MIQKENESLAPVFLRRVREAVFAFNHNISDDQVLINIVNKMGLNGEELSRKQTFQAARSYLEQDFALARSLGVRGFPTIIIVNEENKGVKIVGSRPFEYYVQGLKQILENEELQTKSLPSLAELLKREGLLFSREIEELYALEQEDVQPFFKKNFQRINMNKRKFLVKSILKKSKNIVCENSILK